jgi:hypothetical protein
VVSSQREENEKPLRKITTFSGKKRSASKEVLMRRAIAIATGFAVALAALSSPVMAKNQNAPKAEEKPASTSSCHSYVQNPDGSWTAVPCQEFGPPTQTQHKSPGRGDDNASHQ